MKVINIKGQTFGSLTVIERIENNKHGKAVWRCHCKCGNEVKETIGNLRKIKTCNKCANKRRVSTKHGMANTRIYKIYLGMVTRCKNPNVECYKHYGGRGIKVCDKWIGGDGFKNFYEWATQNGYNNALTIDRIDVDADYSPENCRWIPMKEQGRNKTNTRYCHVYGKKLCVKTASEMYNINYYTFICWVYGGKDGAELEQKIESYKTNKA